MARWANPEKNPSSVTKIWKKIPGHHSNHNIFPRWQDFNYVLLESVFRYSTHSTTKMVTQSIICMLAHPHGDALDFPNGFNFSVCADPLRSNTLSSAELLLAVDLLYADIIYHFLFPLA